MNLDGITLQEIEDGLDVLSCAVLRDEKFLPLLRKAKEAYDLKKEEQSLYDLARSRVQKFGSFDVQNDVQNDVHV